MTDFNDLELRLTQPGAAKSGRGGEAIKRQCFRITKTGGGGDGELTAAATSQAYAAAITIPANATVMGASRKLHEEVAGGSISAAVIDVGPAANTDGVIDAEDVFTGAGTGLTAENPAAPGDGILYTAFPAPQTAALALDVTITLTGDNAVNATAGDVEVFVDYYAAEDPDA